jgi:hypothetical protein
MKNNLTVFITIWLTIPTFSQMVVANGVHDVVYIGAQNHLYIAVDKQNIQTLTFHATGGSLTRLDKLHFIWTSCDTTLKIVDIVCKKGTKRISSVRLRALNIPDPIVSFNTAKSDFHDSNDRPRYISLYFKDWRLPHNFQVIDYFLELAPRDRDTIKISNHNTSFNRQTIEAVATLAKGDKIKIRHLTIQDTCTKRIRTIPDSEYFEIK